MILTFNSFFIVILGIWMFLSIVAQFRSIKLINWINNKDPFSLIPSWTFFAPNPGVVDYQILYRDISDGHYTKWKIIFYRNNSIFHSILNPDKRRRKAIRDCCISILQIESNDPENKPILLSSSYIVLLNYIMTMPKDSLCKYRQFSIMRTFGCMTSKKSEVLFTSCFHKLPSD